MAETADKQIIEEMWTTARLEPVSIARIVAFGFVDRERYKRRVGDVLLTLTLDQEPRSGEWAYRLEIADARGGTLEEEIVQYWLHAFFGREAHWAARRDYITTGEARFSFPYQSG